MLMNVVRYHFLLGNILTNFIDINAGSIDLLPVDDDRDLLRDVLKPVDIPRPHVLEVMVPEDKDDAPMQPVKEVVPFGRSSVTEITKMEHQGVLRDSLVPVLDKHLIHFIHVFERTAAKTDDVGMPEVCVRREEYILAGEFVEGCVFLVKHLSL